MRENEKKPDRRVMKTRRAICGAFMQLLTEKDINDISIMDITDKADINRKTFYNHYSGIHQVADEIENDIIHSFGSVISKIGFQKAMQQPSLIFDGINSVICGDSVFFGYLMSNERNKSFTEKTIHALMEKTKDVFWRQTGLSEQEIDIVIEYTIPGIVNVYQHWFNSGRQQPMEEISRILCGLCFSGINGVCGKDRGGAGA